MAFLEKHLFVKKSTLPGTGKGLFTKVFIPKGKRIVEYKGEIMTWKDVEKMPDYRNGYVFYFNSRYVIDAWKTKKSLAHFANDAKGIVRVDGAKNNSEYETAGKRCFIDAIRDIPAGSEIFVGYGGEYWQAIRYNLRTEERKKEKASRNGARKSLLHQKIAKRQRGH